MRTLKKNLRNTNTFRVSSILVLCFFSRFNCVPSHEKQASDDLAHSIIIYNEKSFSILTSKESESFSSTSQKFRAILNTQMSTVKDFLAKP